MASEPRRFVIVNGIGDTVVRFRGPLVRTLVARGHEVVVSTPRPVERDPATVEAEIRALGASCVFSPLERTSINPLRERAAAAHYRELFGRLAPHGVFASNPKPVFHAIPAARATGVGRRVAMITGLGHAFISDSAKARVLRFVATRLYRRAMRDATAVFFQNDDDLAEFRGRGLLDGCSDVRRCAGSGVDLDEFPERPQPDGPPVFLMVSRLLSDKGVREFVEAARIVRRAEPSARFRLVGWIDSNPAAIRREELDGWIREGSVEFAGRLDDVRAELAACSVFVLPSYREGTPKSVLEAMATGRAIVTTDAPGCRETAEGGVNGLLVPVRDAGALAGACLALARDARRRAEFGRASRARAAQVFDARRVNEAIAEALDA